MVTTGTGTGSAVIAAALVGTLRPDVAKAYGQENARATGWHVTLSAPSADPRQMTYWAFDMAERRAYPLCSIAP
jgi:hypothetical protein